MSNFSRIHFHDTDIKELLYKYKQYECLWNYNSEDYKNQALKQKCWQEIANHFGKDMAEVKRKIKYLRSAYVGEKRKVELSKRSGSDTIYKPSLFYYGDLNFLSSVVVLRTPGHDQSNIDMKFETSTILPEDNDDLGSFANDEEEIDIKETKLNCKIEAFTDNLVELQPSKFKSPRVMLSRTLPSLPSLPPKRRITGEFKCNKAPKRIEEPDRKTQSKNLYSSFGKTIALQLQQMPLEVAVLTMSEIHAIITKKTLEHIKSLRNSQESWQNTDTDEDSFNEIIEEEFEDSD